VARAAGLPARALITDMNQVLGLTAGNALEVQETLDYLKGTAREPRLHALTLALAAQMLHLGGLAASIEAGRSQALAALDSGAAAERFARMVAMLGGPADVFADAGLITAPSQIDVQAPHAGVLVAADVRALGLAVVALGGGRQRPGESIDARVGLSHLLPLGRAVLADEPLARVHAASADAARQAVAAVTAAFTLAEDPAASATGPVVLEALTGA
jgi:thymidine phosphorylase